MLTSATQWNLARSGMFRLASVLVLALLIGDPRPAIVAAQEDVPAPPELTAKAAYALDVDANQPLYALNADEELQPASTTKIATALVVVQHAELPDQVKIEEGDLVDNDVFSNMGLVAGDTLTVELLLYGLLLPSGNDAANALARHVGGSLPGGDKDPTATFVQAMNDLVAELGLEHTHFVNPAGEDADGHYSSAHDLAVLGGELLKVPELATIVDVETYEGQSVGPEARLYTLFTTNDLLKEDGIVGIKTGTTEQAGGCLVTGAFYGTNRVVTVVLGSDTTKDPGTGFLLSPARREDTLTILRAIPGDYEWVAPVAIGGLEDAMAAWQVTLGEGAELVVPTGGEPVDFALRLGPEGSPNEEVGSVVFFVGDRQIAERPLYQL